MKYEHPHTARRRRFPDIAKKAILFSAVVGGVMYLLNNHIAQDVGYRDFVPFSHVEMADRLSMYPTITSPKSLVINW